MKRIKWVDLGKCICILFVMISHMSYVPDLLRCLFKPVFLTFFCQAMCLTVTGPSRTF